MGLTIELNPDEEALLRAAARERGVDPHECIRQLLLERTVQARTGSPAPLQPIPAAHFYETASEAEWEAAMDALAAGSERLPVLPPEAFDRENLYEDRF